MLEKTDQQVTSVQEEETSPVMQKELSLPDLEATYTMYSEKGLSADDATKSTAADLLSSSFGIDVETALETVNRLGANEVIISITGAKDRTGVGAFLESVARNVPGEYLGAEAGLAAAAKTFRSLPLAGPFAIPVVRGGVSLLAGLAAYMGTSGATKKGIEMVVPEAPYLPEDRPAREAGKTVAAFAGAIPASTKALAKLPEKPLDAVAGRLLSNQASNPYVQRTVQRTGQLVEAVGKGLGQAGRVARETPKALLPAETYATMYGGLAAYGAEKMAPGQTLERVGAEIVLPVMSPHRMVATGVAHFAPGTLEKIKGFFRGAEYRNDQNALALVESLDRLGEAFTYLQPDGLKSYFSGINVLNREGNPVNLSALVDEFTTNGRFDSQSFFKYVDEGKYQDPEGLDFNSSRIIEESGAISGYNADDVLEALSGFQLIGPNGVPISGADLLPSLMVDNPEIGKMLRVLEAAYLKNNPEVLESNRQALLNITSAINTLQEARTPEALQLAEQLKEERFKSLLSTLIDARISRSVNATTKVTGPAGSAARENLGEQILLDFKAAIDDWRTLEKNAYNRVNLNQDVPVENLRALWLKTLSGENGLNVESVSQLEKTVAANLNNTTGLAAEKEAIEQAGKEVSNQLAELNKRELSLVKELEKLDIRLSDLSRDKDFLNTVLADANLSTPEGVSVALRDVDARLEDLGSLDSFAVSALKPELKNAKSYLTVLAKRLDRQQRLNEVISAKDGVEVPQQLGLGFGDIPEDSLGRLQNLRSQLLSLARLEGASDPGSNIRRIYGELAEAALEDISAVAQKLSNRKIAGETLTATEEALLEAHRISKSGNDVFRRGAANSFGRKNNQGANAIPPEMVVDNLFKGSADKTYSLFQGLKEAVDYLGATGELGSVERTNSLLSTYNAAVKNVLNRITKEVTFVDPSGARRVETVIDPNKARRELNPDSPLGSLLNLPEFALLKADLEDALSSQTLSAAYANPRLPGLIEKRLRQNAVLGKSFNVDNPTQIIADALSSRANPRSSFMATIKRVNSLKQRSAMESGPAPQDIEEAFVSAVFDWALINSTRGEIIRPQIMFEKLFRPVAKDNPSVMQMLQQANFVDEGTATRLRVLLNKMADVERVVQSGGRMDDVLESDSPVTQFALRLLGAQLGARAGRAVGVGTIQAPGAGATLALSLFSKMPRTFSIEYMRELVKPGNAKLLEQALTRGIELRNEKVRKTLFDGLSGLFVSVFGVNPRTIQPIARETREEIEAKITAEEPNYVEDTYREVIPQPQPEPTAPEPRATGPLSVINNNPGNLRLAGQPGAVEGEGGFAAFASPGQGLRALTRQVVLDTQTRNMSLEDFLNKYAPPTENETNKYISFVERQTGLDAKGKVPESKVPQLVRAIVRMEGGQAAVDYFYGQQRAEAEAPQEPPLAQAAPPPMPSAPPSPAPLTPQSLQRTAQVLGPNDEIGRLASELMMRQGPA